MINNNEDAGNRTLIVGFDGMDWRYLDRFADDLSEINSLREDGTAARLKSTHPPWTASAWPSMYTGVSPDHHGVFDFFDYDGSYPDTARTVTRADVRAPALWNYLTALDIPSVVLNLPVTHPAEPLDGVLIPGYLSPADEPGYPEEIRDDVSEAIGEQYRIYSTHESTTDAEKRVAGYVDLLEMRARAGAYLLDAHPWQLAIVQFQKTDAVFHNSSDPSHFRRVYAAANDALEVLRDAVDDETNIIVCSDHGMGPVDGYKIHVNQILENNGYLTSSVDSTGPGDVNIERAANAEEGGPLSTLFRTGFKASAAIGLPPAKLYNVADRLGLGEPLIERLPEQLWKGSERNVLWADSVAYCRHGSEQGIRLNLEGRDPAGVVPRSAYEDVRSEIIALLASVRTPTGEKAFEFVCPREELYTGPYSERACDVLFLPTEMNHTVSTKLHGVEFSPTSTYDHKRTGVFIGSGPGFTNTDERGRIDLVDIAPIAMSVLGYPVPERMTGDARDDLLTVPTTVEAYDVSIEREVGYDQDQDEVRDRLSDLGYL
ncbi:alkaline phosphatase family protein [Natronorubrum sp. DTA28]|uniref:alkaline phosphatase family protein n=1 Tax=Natronorubrum sp. DTA28 TaxID=3447019 RepID=UPI003F8779EC